MQIWSVSKNTPKTWRVGPQPGDFEIMCQIKPKRQIIFVLVFFALVVVSVLLSCCSFGRNEKILFYSSIGRRVAKWIGFSTDLSEPMLYGNEVGIGLRFPPKIRLVQYLSIMKTVFFKITLFLPELPGNFKIFWFTVRPWEDCPNLESHGQTMRVGLHIVVLRSYHLQWTSIIDSSEGYRLAVHVISITNTSFKMVNKHLWLLLVLFNRALAWGGAAPAPLPPFFCLRNSKHVRIKVACVAGVERGRG